MIYGSWNIRCDRQKSLSFWTIFCHFSPLTTQKIKLSKLKKTLGDITILHICTINENHMMYGYWDMECDMTESLSFWTTSCPFTPLRTHKIEILKKWKKPLKILQMCFINESHMMYGSQDMECNGQFFCHFGQFFHLCKRWKNSPKWQKKLSNALHIKKIKKIKKNKILKKWKKHLEMLSFYTSVP